MTTELTTELTTTVLWKRKRYRLTPHRDGWRLRSRARGDEFDWQFPPCSADKARELALEKFARDTPASTRGASTLEDVVTTYLKLPKKAGEESAKINVSRLRGVVRIALNKELKQVLVSEAGPKLWNAFMEKRSGGKLDFSKKGRKPENDAINSAVRQAASIFIPRLRPGYREQGIEIPADATVIQWLVKMKLPKPKVAMKSLLDAWRSLPPWRPLPEEIYYAVGLARFAGLRQQEISACDREWIVKDKGAVYVVMHDRVADDGDLYRTKTGEMYRAIIIDPTFAKALLKIKKGKIVKNPEGMSRSYWFRYYPQEWLKWFTGKARKPLHRLRGLYADDVKRIKEDAMAAHLAGVKAASKNLGHTSTRTTEGYLTT